jgi:hypothetical protein
MAPGCVGLWAWVRSDLRRTCRGVERSDGQDAVDGSFSVGQFREFHRRKAPEVGGFVYDVQVSTLSVVAGPSTSFIKLWLPIPLANWRLDAW